MKYQFTFTWMKRIGLVLMICLLGIKGYGQMGEWTWMNGDSTLNSLGHYGTQGVFSPNNTPSGLYETCEWTDLEGNFWLFSGVGGNGLGDLWEFKPMLNQWALIKGDTTGNGAGIYGVQGIPAPANNPGGRAWGVATWVDTTGDLWLFGGDGNDINGNNGYLNDLWRYNISTNEWTWISGKNIVNDTGNYGIILISNPQNRPPARSETNASWTDNNNNLWLFGGVGLSGLCISDMWKFETSSLQWIWMKGPNIPNQPAVYGTKGIPDSTNTPSGRMCYAKWKESNGSFWLFGGEDSNGTENDLWNFNPITLNWTWMKGSNIGGYTDTSGTQCNEMLDLNPSSRYENRSCWTRKCDNFVNFGGSYSSGQENYNDLWNYNVMSNKWTLMNGSVIYNQLGNYGTILVSTSNNMPPSRFGSVGWSDILGNLWLFGGWKDDLSPKYFNDMWKFTPDTTCPNLCLGEGIRQVKVQPTISIYPNPNNGTFTLSYSQLQIPNSQFIIVDVLGRTVYTHYIYNIEGKETIDVSDLSNGVYFYQLINGKETLRGKFVKE